MNTAPIGGTARWTGRVLSGLAVLFLLFSSVLKLAAPPEVIATFVTLGIPAQLATGLGLLELSCTLVYAIPRTALLGAILLTGYLGGAIATHLRMLDPWLSHTLFPLYVGALVWGGLLLRDRRVRELALAVWQGIRGCRSDAAPGVIGTP